MAITTIELERIIKPAVESCGNELWGLEYLSRKGQSLLRVYIELPQGITVDMCAEASRQISAVLDVEDVIAGKYTLEVSSPGLDRRLFKLAHYQQHIDQTIHVRLYVAFDGRRNFTGVLVGIEDDDIVLRIEEDEFVLPFASIDKANVVV